MQHVKYILQKGLLAFFVLLFSFQTSTAQYYTVVSFNSNTSPATFTLAKPCGGTVTLYCQDPSLNACTNYSYFYNGCFLVNTAGDNNCQRIGGTPSGLTNCIADPCGVEYCNNGFDDDNDGLTDYLDPDCTCYSSAANAVEFDFSDYTVIQGSGLNLNDKIRYNDVGKVNNQWIDVIATVESLSNISALVNHGIEAAGDNDALVRLPNMNNGVGSTYSSTVRYDLVYANTNTIIPSASFEIEVKDVDKTGNRIESISISNSQASYYFLSNPTNLVTTFNSNEMTFTGTQNQAETDANGAVKFLFNDKNSFKVTYRSYQFQSGGTGNAGFELDGNDFTIFGDCLTDEDCTNGVDDDGDGLVDCLDSECLGITKVVLNTSKSEYCTGETATLTATVTGGSGLNYSWQYSSDGTTWINAGTDPNSNVWNLTNGHLANTNRWWRVVITNSANCSYTSHSVKTTFIGTPAVTVNNSTICSGGSATLTASGYNASAGCFDLVGYEDDIDYRGSLTKNTSSISFAQNITYATGGNGTNYYDLKRETSGGGYADYNFAISAQDWTNFQELTVGISYSAAPKYQVYIKDAGQGYTDLGSSSSGNTQTFSLPTDAAFKNEVTEVKIRVFAVDLGAVGTTKRVHLSNITVCGRSLTWNTGETTTSITKSPTATTNYTATVRYGDCSQTATGTVTVVSNFTNSGTIAANQSNCSSYDPANMTETAAASGGSGGTAQYIWESSINNGTTWTAISGATSATFDPTTITQTTLYRRGARRSPCTAYVYSNTVTKAISSCSEICNNGTDDDGDGLIDCDDPDCVPAQPDSIIRN